MDRNAECATPKSKSWCAGQDDEIGGQDKETENGQDDVENGSGGGDTGTDTASCGVRTNGDKYRHDDGHSKPINVIGFAAFSYVFRNCRVG